jgi:hypothetical protein
VAVAEGESIGGVAIAGRPIARKLDDGQTVEITRCCTTGARNGCSMLYGALVRAARSLGYARVVTYTLESESGASLRATGAVSRPSTTRDGQGWDNNVRRREDSDLFGARLRPTGKKTVWTWTLCAQAPTARAKNVR